MQEKKRVIVTFSLQTSHLIQEEAARLEMTPNRWANTLMARYFRRKRERESERARHEAGGMAQ